MSWPFGLSFPNQAEYMNNLHNFCQPFFQTQFGSNQITNLFGTGLFNFPPTYSLYPQNYCPFNAVNINNGMGEQIPHPAQQNPANLNAPNQLQNSALSEQKQSSFSSDSIRMVRFRRRRKVKKPKNMISHNSSLRNDTKNIPKNYGKAMLAYIQKNSRQAKALLSEMDVDIMEFMMVVKSFKTKINTIHDLRQMWGQNEKDDRIKKCIRILSYHFMRKKCLPYIFNSRVKNYHTHIKYRKKIMQGIQNPEKFTKIKQF